MGRSQFSSTVPLGAGVDREQAVAFLHSHAQMIEVNPLVIRHEQAQPPDHVTPEEATEMTWYDITDRVEYIPGLAFTASEVTYKAGFMNLPDGVRTHVFAPAGVEIHGRWTVEDGEVLQLREDVDLRCVFLLTAFVRRNLEKSHRVVAAKVAAAPIQQ